MKAKVTTVMETTTEKLWDKISQPASLIYVSSPILKFVPIESTNMDSTWDADDEYRLKLYFMKIIPMGKHTIRFSVIDREANKIISQESGSLASVWNHTITFEAIDGERIRYTDTIEIGAGILTPLVWAFANWFYRHRQRRWAKLLENDLV